MTPRLSRLTPATSRSRSSMSGTRPAPCTAMSASKRRSLPSWRPCTTTPPPAASRPRTSVFSSTRMPSSRVRLTSRFTRSGSKASSGRAPRSRMVTSAPARAATWANSNEMYPPPTKIRREGSRSRFRNSSLVVSRAAPANGSGAGFAPAAMRMRRPTSRPRDSVSRPPTSPPSRRRPGRIAVPCDRPPRLSRVEIGSPTSLDDPFRPQQQRRRDREAERPRRLRVDHQLELRGLLDGQVAGFRALENLVDVHGGTPEQVREIGTVRHQAPGFHDQAELAHDRQPMLEAQLGDEGAVRDRSRTLYGASDEHAPLHYSMLKCASVVRPVSPLIGRMSWGHAENATTRSISARNSA